ncbi:MAG: NAD(P)/FAD-dependent oxidoreductase [Candidatus Berkelbacteria bacterium]
MENNLPKIHDVAIIGGGASGMMAAIIAARQNKSVILIEKNAELGRKILATGNGRCNLTNKFIESSRYHGGHPKFIESVLAQFDQFETMNFFENLGLILKEENLGRIFPRSDQASSVVNALIHELETNHVEIILNNQARKIEKLSNIFHTTLANGQKIISHKLILSTGGQAAEHLGTSGDAYFWLKNFGHSTTDLYPALAPLETKETWVKEVQGLKIEAKITATVNNEKIYEKTGDALFTHFGVSGPAAMAQAGAIGQYLSNQEVKIHLDLFPEEQLPNLNIKFIKIIETSGAKQIKNVLAGIIPSNLSPLILDQLGINPDKKAAEISKDDRKKIVEKIKNIELTIVKTRPFREAQVTHGGAILDQINPKTLESKIVPGLYLTGELLDVDGDSGGFNLQWAWSSGYLAGQSCSKI